MRTLRYLLTIGVVGIAAWTALRLSAGTALAAPASPPADAHEVSIASSVGLSGNLSLTTGELRAAMQKATTVEEASARVEETYVARGYVAAKVIVMPALGRDPAVLTIVEGKRFKLGRIEAVEAGEHAKKDALSDAKALRSTLTLREGDVFARQRVIECMQALRDRYDAAGYGSAMVTPITSIDTDAGTVGIRLEIQRGLSRKISAIDVTGTKDVARVRQIVLAKVGDVFSNRKQREATKRLLADKQLKNALIEALDEPAGIRWLVTVEEKAAK